jgi:hypothetical protein
MNRMMACVVAGVLSVSCKKVHETASPRKPDLKVSSQVVADNLSAFIKRDVSFDDVPRISITVDIRECVGSGRWFDPAKPVTTRTGAISVTLTHEGPLAADQAQPDTWLMTPEKNSSSNDASVDGSPISSWISSSTYAWRVPKGIYRVDAVAFGTPDNTLESKITTSLDAKQTNDLKATVLGVWSSTQKCQLKWP